MKRNGKNIFPRDAQHYKKAREEFKSVEGFA
jgi:hypothetical protein